MFIELIILINILINARVTSRLRKTIVHAHSVLRTLPTLLKQQMGDLHRLPIHPNNLFRIDETCIGDYIQFCTTMLYNIVKMIYNQFLYHTFASKDNRVVC